MTEGLTVFAPLRMEAARLRRTLPAASVVRTGAGRHKATAAAAYRLSRGPVRQPVAVAGIGGGLSARVAPGDVVVATEVHGPDGTAVPCPAAQSLADVLRRRSLPVRLGPVASDVRLALGARRQRLAGTGALVADTESVWLLAGTGIQNAVCVRVVADCPPVPLLHPRTLRGLLLALDRLPAVGSALAEWAARSSGTQEREQPRQPREVRQA